MRIHSFSAYGPKFDVKSRNLFAYFLRILLFSAYGPKLKYSCEVGEQVPRFYVNFTARKQKSKVFPLLLILRWFFDLIKHKPLISKEWPYHLNEILLSYHEKKSPLITQHFYIGVENQIRHIFFFYINRNWHLLFHPQLDFEIEITFSFFVSNHGVLIYFSMAGSRIVENTSSV